MIVAQGSFDPQGPAAESMADLWWLMLALGAAVFLLFLVLLVIGLVRRRNDDEDAGSEGRLVRRWLVGGGLVLPTVVLLVVFAATLVTMRAVPSAHEGDALVVELVGHQWWYEVRYPQHGIVTANEVHLPVGRPVRFEVTSADVIHSFWVPALGGKIDMLPDGPNTMVLQADQPGEHHSLCAEFCGLQHARMGMVVVAEPTGAFDAWVRRHQAEARPPAGARAERGRETFAANCARCHRVAGSGMATDEAATGPALTHLASRRTLAAGVLENTEANLRRWLRDPQSVKAGAKMKSAGLGPEELDDLVSYLMGLE